ncbi:MAG TPA: Rieske 2Fe-2S domain-containing protein [Actinomycetota bacterium]
MTASLASSVVTPRSVAVMIAIVMVGLFLFILGWSLLQTRRRTAVVPPTAEEAAAGAKPKRVPVARRDFLRRGLLASLAVFAAEFGGASLAFLWPNLKGQFGSVVTAGSLDDIKSYIEQNSQPFYLGAGRFYIVPYNGNGTDTIYAGLVDQGLMALYQRCVHLGCRVPFCQASQWFECPCHGSKYNEAGEYQLGPAPHGMDRFPLTISNDIVSVDTSNQVLGPPRGTNTTNQAPEGPFCVGGSAGG